MKRLNVKHLCILISRWKQALSPYCRTKLALAQSITVQHLSSILIFVIFVTFVCYRKSKKETKNTEKKPHHCGSSHLLKARKPLMTVCAPEQLMLSRKWGTLRKLNKACPGAFMWGMAFSTSTTSLSRKGCPSNWMFLSVLHTQDLARGPWCCMKASTSCTLLTHTCNPDLPGGCCLLSAVPRRSLRKENLMPGSTRW